MTKPKAVDLPDCLFEHSGIPDHDHKKAVEKAAEKPWPDENNLESMLDYFDDMLASATTLIKAIGEGDSEAAVSELKSMPMSLVVFAAIQYGEKLNSQDPSHTAKIIAEHRSNMARLAADALHDKPGGSRDRRQQMIDIWATGKYTTRDICAEEECASLGVSFRRARGYLVNSPDPKRHDDA